MTDPKDPGPLSPMGPDGTHFAPAEFQEASGRAEYDDTGHWRYIPGPGEDGYDPADWA